MLTNGQKKALHAAARQAKVGELWRRIIQRKVGGFHSAADRTATREGFIAVMAFYEKLVGGRLAGCTEGYWRDQRAGSQSTDALVYAVRFQARQIGMDSPTLDAFISGPHMSSGACPSVAGASAYWLGRCLEALKAMAARKRRPA